MSPSRFRSQRRISASLQSRPMRLTTCSYRRKTWNGQYECLNGRGIAFACKAGISSQEKKSVLMQAPAPRPIYIIGDVHGQLKKLVKLLQDRQLIDAEHCWKAGTATLWFMGDVVDRGPDGVAVLDLVMRLQAEAAAAGGAVASLLGNHEMLLLAAYRFGRRSTGLGS